MYRIAIVEDDPADSKKLEEYLSLYRDEHDLSLEVSVFPSGLPFIVDYKPNYDVILLDIDLPHMTGMEVARKIREVDHDVCLIFITYMAKYAVEGYSVNALDFLVKPVGYVNFSLKLKKALDYRDRIQKKELILMTATRMQRLLLDDIYYVEVLNHTLVYHTRSGELAERGSIKEREAELERYDFARCNNSFLVNLRYVQSMAAGTVVVQGRVIPIGRTKKKEFLRRLTEFMGANI